MLTAGHSQHTHTHSLSRSYRIQGSRGLKEPAVVEVSTRFLPSPYKPLTVGQVTSRLQTESPEIDALVDEIRKITMSYPEEGEETERSLPLQIHTSSPRPFSFQVTMSAGNVTPWGSSAAGEEVWVGSGIEVEGAELPTFSVAAEVRMGVTVVLFVSSAGGNLAVLWSVKRPQPSQLCPSPVRRLFAHLAVADLLVTFVVMPPDATWNITVQWLAGDITCRTLVFLKLVAMYAAAFLPGYWARPPGSRTPPVWTALSWKETSWGSLGTQLPAHLAPGE